MYMSCKLELNSPCNIQKGHSTWFARGTSVSFVICYLFPTIVQTKQHDSAITTWNREDCSIGIVNAEQSRCNTEFYSGKVWHVSHIVCPSCHSHSSNHCSDTLIVLSWVSWAIFFMTMAKLMLAMITSDLVWDVLFDDSSHLFYVFVLHQQKCMWGISLTLNLCRSQRLYWWWQQGPWSFCFNCFGR